MENKTIFVGNLVFDLVEEDLQSLLSEYGIVTNIRLHQKKGYAIVEMADPMEAEAIISHLDQSDFKGRPLRINIEMPPKKAKAKAMTLQNRIARGKSFNQAREGFRKPSDRPTRDQAREGFRKPSDRPTRDQAREGYRKTSDRPTRDQRNH